MGVNEFPNRHSLACYPEKLLQTVGILWDSALGIDDGGNGSATYLPRICIGAATAMQQECDGAHGGGGAYCVRS